MGDAPLLCWASEDLLALHKPAGIPVFPPHGAPEGDSVLRRLLAEHPEQDQPFPEGFSGGIAHRLDTPTSGQLLVARSPAALDRLRAAFGGGQLRKVYRFVSARPVPWDRHLVTAPLAHDARRRDRMIAARGPNTPHRGRWFPAETQLRRLAPIPGHPGGWLWEAVIRTGVTHQIRLHAAIVGLALRGDRLYGGGPPLSEVDLPGLPAGVPFLLHHLGLSGPDLQPPRCPLPDYWPR